MLGQLGLDPVVNGPSLNALSAVAALGGFAAAALPRVRSWSAFGVRRVSWRWLLAGAGVGLLAWVLARLAVVAYVAITGDSANVQDVYVQGAGAVDDVLVLTTKTQQAEGAINEWADVPVHGRDGTVAGRAADLLPIFTASNGVTSEEIALRHFQRVFAVCVWFPAVMIEPGEVIVRGAPLRGVFHVGRYGTSSDLCGESDESGDARLMDTLSRDWDGAGCVIRRPDSVMEWKYRKLLANLGNVLQALLGDTSGAEDVQRAADAEARTVLEAAGIAFTGDEESRAGWQPEGLTFRPVPGEPAQLGGSSWQSLVRGTGAIETDFLNGEIALIARRIGRPASINARLTALARHAAREGLRPGSVGVEELRAQLAL